MERKKESGQMPLGFSGNERPWQDCASGAEQWLESGSLLQRCCLLRLIAVLSEHHLRLYLPLPWVFPLVFGCSEVMGLLMFHLNGPCA